MSTDTRQKMVLGAAELLRRRGLNATSLREVVKHTGTPRGSIRHHFPQGKRQLVEEALLLAGRSVSAQLRQRVQQAGALGGLAAFIEGWKQTLEQSDFEAGCPILAVAAEQYVAEDGYPNAEVQDQLLQRTAAAFAEWQSILREALQKEGIAADQARPLATVIISAVEGAVTMCRAAKSTAALSEVEWVLSGLLRTALPSTPA